MEKISALMSVYNEEKYIKETILSILQQTYENFELIIVDDGSTDETVSIVESFKDPRIKLYKLKENRGVGYALNFGLQKCTGKYIAKVDGDDLYHPERFKLQKKFLDENQDVTLVKALIEYFPDTDEVCQSERYKRFKDTVQRKMNDVISRKELQDKTYWYCCVPHQSMMIRADVAKEIGYRPLKVGGDHDFFYRLNKRKYVMDTIEKVLTWIRVSKGSVTDTFSEEYKKVVWDIKKEEFESLFKGNSPVYLWGAGSFGKNVLDILYENGLHPVGFIDSDLNKIGKIIKGLKVYSKEHITDNSCKIIVTSL